MIKLVASDLDGTLILNEYNKNDIDPQMFDIIRELHKRGIHFAAASGRQYANLRNVFAPVADEIDYICENGALVVYNGEIVFRDEINRKEGQDLMARIMAIPQAEVLLSGVDTCYIAPKTKEYYERVAVNLQNVTEVVDDILATEEPYLKISMFHPDGISDELHEYFDKLCNDGTYTNLTCALGGRQWLDFFHKDVHKGTALKILEEKLGVGSENTMVFGDNENDVGLMQEAAYSYCMASGNPKTKEKAKFICESVPEVLNEYLSRK
ncbi:MAG: HAD family hydrolase [Clostridia bacterium]|nr:HAD family hydrolase [Clostridia bacterium]